MKKNFVDSTEHALLIPGLVLFLINVLIFSIPFFAPDFAESISLFVIIHLFTLVYTFCVMGANRKKFQSLWKFKNRHHNIPLLLNWNIGAYALNRDLAVFGESVVWLAVFLILYSLALMYISLVKEYKTNLLYTLIAIILTAGLIFQFYQVIYTFRLYPITIVSFWFFGVSIYALVPIFHFFLCLYVVRDLAHKSHRMYSFVGIGAVLSFTAIFAFVTQWSSLKKPIEESFHVQQKVGQSDLPFWVEFSQTIPKGLVTKRLLVGELMFASGRDIFNIDGLAMANSRKHDPLVMIASLIGGDLDLPKKDRIKILQSIYNKRHETEEKLWSGNALHTTDIVSNVELLPEYRIAYTEKTFKIKHDGRKWSRQQEALYTFYLPEGSVVTSASLWIEGVEQKSYLTTKTKADSAYKTIVGRERRDPLLVHWQEGNQVTARIFPCTKKESRQFKIGVTTPLRYEDGKLIYENIDFKGPDFSKAKESINIVSKSEINNLESPYSFSTDGEQFNYFGKYLSSWDLKFDALPIAKTPFTFNGKTYSLSAIEKDIIKLSSFDSCYLDINASWSKREIKQILNSIKGMEVFVFDGHRKKLTSSNSKKLIKKLRKLNYSLFPFYALEENSNSLVISKSDQLTPTLNDLDGTPFAKEMEKHLQKQNKNILVINIEDEISPYLKTLKSLRAFNFIELRKNELMECLQTGEVEQVREGERTVSNNYSQTQIKLSAAGDKVESSSDHLMRLYVYNDLMKTIGKSYYERKSIEEELITKAKEANVLCPVSSMIVLETQKDYERFDIKKSKNSLGNAELLSSGSVPEPHEWFLIIICISGMLFFYLRLKF